MIKSISDIVVCEDTAASSYTATYSLEDCPTVQWSNMNTPAEWTPCGLPVYPTPQCNNNKKGNTMCYDCEDMDTTAPLEARQKGYLNERLFSIYLHKLEKAKLDFGLKQDDLPNTANELIERITSGRYVVEKDTGDKKFYWDNLLSRAFKWKDPSKVADQKGYDKYEEDLSKTKIEVEDVIMIGQAEEALAAIKEFEAK